MTFPHKNWQGRTAALRIVAIYAIIGCLWVFCSDAVLDWITHDPSLMTQIAMYKGLLFVLTTAFLLYHLIARHVLRLTRANRRIAASEERFQAIYDNMLEAVLILEPDSGVIIEANRTAGEIFGYSLEEVRQITIQEICSGDPSFSGFEFMERLALAAKGIPQLMDRIAKRKNGTVFWVGISMRKAQLAGEEQVIALIRDISETKRIEEELQLKGFAVENMTDAVEWLTMDARFWEVNSAGCKMLGYSRDEMLTFSVADIDPNFSLEEWQSHLNAIRQSGNIQHTRYHRSRAGRVFPVEITSNYFDYNGKEYYCAIVRDISERVTFEEEVSFFRNLVESSSDPFYVLSPRQGWRMMYANQAACAHFGMTLEELQQKSISDWDPDFDMEQIEVLYQQLKQGQPIRFETRHQVASGKTIPVEVTTNYLKHGDEELSFGSFYDITERKRAVEELRASEGHLRTLVQTLPDLVWLKDKDGVYISCNQMFERFFGAREADIVGKTDYDFVDRELADFFVENDRKAMAAGKATTNEEWITFADDGRCALLETIKTPMYDDRGELIGVLGIGRDITERKRVEEELRESEVRYRGLVELFPEAIYIHTGGKLAFVNSQGAKMLGAESPEVLYGREALDFVHPDYREFVTKRINRAYDRGIPNPPVEEVFLRLDGSPVQVEVSSNAFSYHGEKALQIVARDISERKKRQEELVRAQKLESLGVLAGGIAHDFNNLLTGVMGNLSLMREELPADHSLQERLIRCEKAINQTTGLTCQLLTFSRGGEPVKKLLDLRSVLRDTTSFALRGSNVALEMALDDDLWPLEADEGQLCQIFNNLVINAGQAMPSGGIVRVEARNCPLFAAEIPPLKPGDYLKVSVSDQGTGIPPEYLDKIFDPYFTTKDSGSGLGLTALYSIVRKHHGQVLVSSQVGNGTTFDIYLPACPEKAGLLPVSEDEAHSGIAIAETFILVMDDEETIRDLSEEMLRHLGCQVATCSSGEELIDFYRQKMSEGSKPDVVIMDLTIPGKMGGLEAAQRILEIDREARLIVSSGYSNDPVIANYRAYGFVDFLVKPYRVDDLSGVLSRVL